MRDSIMSRNPDYFADGLLAQRLHRVARARVERVVDGSYDHAVVGALATMSGSVNQNVEP